MRICGLRAALAATHNVDRWVLHDPRAWLGIAFHRVVEAVRSGNTQHNPEQVWEIAVAEAALKASHHPLDSRYSKPERWPSYFLVRQRGLATAALMGSTGQTLKRFYRPGPSGIGGGAERLLEARGGRLVGRPDYYDGDTISEYKSAIPDQSWQGAEQILDSLSRQVRLYAAIIADAMGRWPAHGRVVAASGQALDILIDPSLCDAEADSAVTALSTLNSSLAAGATPESLARPSPATCHACPFQILCPAFWKRLADSDMQSFAGVAIEGGIDSLEPGPDGDLFTIRLSVRVATHHLAREQPVVLSKSVHGTIDGSQIGGRCRLVGGSIRPDGRVRADLTTVVFPVAELPVLMNGDRGFS